ncbi:hypothetical protein M2T00_23245, partial [Klebsiella pneumoniae]|nr:hypothetical protein [Klebsiella pneumoniae]
CGKKIGPDPRNFNQRVSLGRNDLLIRTFPNIIDEKIPKAIIIPAKSASERSNSFPNFMPNKPFPFR